MLNAVAVSQSAEDVTDDDASHRLRGPKPGSNPTSGHTISIRATDAE
jgi:hypothetical protein